MDQPPLTAPRSSPQTSWEWHLDSQGLAWITFDNPHSTANVFESGTLDELDQLLTELTRFAPRGAIILSGKKRVFTAGASLQWLAQSNDAQTAAGLSAKGQRVFSRLNAARFPIVCAVHGAAAGGGYELALACHWRLASEAPETQMGLPEVSLGTLPGWGGCVRLPRLIGAGSALAHILNAKLISAAEARSQGMIDELTPAEDLRERARQAALRLASEGVPSRIPGADLTATEYAELTARTVRKSRGFLPALAAAIEVVQQSFELPVAEALVVESTQFGLLTSGSTCKNLFYAFSLRERARKRSLAGWFPEAAQSAPTASIRRVGVIGAGVMGAGIAHWCASRGLEVVLTDLNSRQVESGLAKIHRLLEDSVARGVLSQDASTMAAARIAASTEQSALNGCDLIIEAIIENMEAKQALFRDLARHLPPNTLLASNTSALPIDEIFADVPNQARTLGLHFFNPVSRMALIEVVLSRSTSAETADAALGFAKALDKSPVICRSSPGFLVTRVLFFYLNEACRLWEQGVSSEVIDRALQNWGWPMGPMRLIDEVGVDVTDFIFIEMEAYFPHRFKRASICSRLLAADLKGRKGGKGAGFYLYEEKRESINPIPDRLMTNRPQPKEPTEEFIRDHLMNVMSAEAAHCLDEGVVLSTDDVDFALVAGAGFPSFRGGLLRSHSSIGTPSCPERFTTH